jgi:hypothetical protein
MLWNLPLGGTRLIDRHQQVAHWRSAASMNLQMMVSGE